MRFVFGRLLFKALLTGDQICIVESMLSQAKCIDHWVNPGMVLSSFKKISFIGEEILAATAQTTDRELLLCFLFLIDDRLLNWFMLL